MKHFVRVKGVSKRFGDFTAVDNVDLDIEQGELFSISLEWISSSTEAPVTE